MLGGWSKNDETLASSELWDGKTWKTHDPLPTPLWGHCVVKLNSSHVFIAGGNLDYYGQVSNASYIYSKDTGFVEVPPMTRERCGHACGLHGGKIIAAGGFDNQDDDTTKGTSEIFDLETLEWSEGPSLDPQKVIGGKIVSLEDKTILIGNKDIWLLGVEKESWKWTKVAEMETSRLFFQAFTMTENDCKDWK